MTETLAEVLAGCAAGDDGAAGTLVSRFQPWALDFAASILDEPMYAQDVVQEAFVAALARLADLRDPQAFPGWFRQIVRTQVSRTNRRHRELRLDDGRELPCNGPSPRETLQRSRLAEHVRAAMAGLRAPHRETAELFYFQEASLADIAARLHVPIGTVKRRLHDARRTLRLLLMGVMEESGPAGPRHTPPSRLRTGTNRRRD